jgi:hypothetical protein
MVRSSSRSRAGAALLLTSALAAAAGMRASAHRLDEYLQAARLAIDPDRVQIELDLTPGISVAAAVLSDADANRDGVVSPAEVDACARHVLEALAIDVDGVALSPRLIARTFPSMDAIRNGEGTIRLRIAADAGSLAAGAHHLHYRNGYRSDIGIYLANALVPVNDRVTVTDQRRDIDQRELRVDFVLSGDPRKPSSTAQASSLAAALVTLAFAAGLWRYPRRRSAPQSRS